MITLFSSQRGFKATAKKVLHGVHYRNLSLQATGDLCPCSYPLFLSRNTFCMCSAGRRPYEPKDMVKNKSPFSREFGNGAVVPLGQVIIKNDLHVLFEIGSVFAPRFIHLVQNPY